MDVPFLLFIAVLALFWAKMEIQIEGKDGWARNLPTWRIEKNPIFSLVLGGTELTGYHLWAFSCVFLFFHLPFLWQPWSWRAEWHVIGGYSLFWVVEDYLWFVLNPHYGPRGLTPAKAWWHKRWFLKFPLNYWIVGLLGGTLFFLT